MNRFLMAGLLFALSTACVAQVGQPTTEDPGSQPESLTAEQVAAKRTDVTAERAAHGGVVLPHEGNLEIGGPGVDPGAPVQDDGDGREPQPQPWHRSADIAPVKR